MPELHEQCPAHSGITEALQNLYNKDNQLEETDKEQWEQIRRLQNRPPVWTTIVISVLTFALGSALTYASLATRLAG